MSMRKTLLFAIAVSFLASCGDSDIPDVSNVEVKLQTKHFERDFFSIDTNQLIPSLQQLNGKYPEFLQDYIQNILGLQGRIDTGTHVQNGLKSFIATYKPVFDSAEKKFRDFDKIQNDVKRGLQFVKYYFPAYKTPESIITFVGPIEGFQNVLTSEGLAVGLQSYLGKDFFLYNTEMGQTTYPAYISRRFSPEYIPVNSMKNIISDIYPTAPGSKSLVDAMVEKGKELYVLDKVLPETADTLKIGYTKNQLEGCYSNEGLIWNFFLKNNLVNSIDADVHKYYLEEGPNTPEFGQGAPGSIGTFVGWQIVKQWMEKNPKTSLANLLNTDPRKIFEESKYRPK
jgi:hypothetical protein